MSLDMDKLDLWIDQLKDCKCLTEAEVKQLCEKVMNYSLHVEDR